MFAAFVGANHCTLDDGGDVAIAGGDSRYVIGFAVVPIFSFEGCNGDIGFRQWLYRTYYGGGETDESVAVDGHKLPSVVVAQDTYDVTRTCRDKLAFESSVVADSHKHTLSFVVGGIAVGRFGFGPGLSLILKGHTLYAHQAALPHHLVGGGSRTHYIVHGA